MIYILTGAIETGKSKALLKWLKGRKDVSGILSPRNTHNKRYFLNVNTLETFKMQANAIDEAIISVGRYHFFNSAFVKANTIIKQSVKNNNFGFIIIDEIGKLELRSEGLHESATLAIQKGMQHKRLHVILVVRTSLLNDVLQKYAIENPQIINPEQLSELHHQSM